MLASSVFPNDAYALLDSLDCDHLGVQLKVLRLDSYYPEMSGNKLFKLKYNILHALEQGCQQIVSFGGAYSNHIHALAMAGKIFGIKTIGIIRGERTEPLNSTLRDAEAAGMELHFVSREQYRLRHEPTYLQQIMQTYAPCILIPEGGSNNLGMKGCGEIIDHIHHHIGFDYDYLALACGTGATMAGMLAVMPGGKRVVGFSVLKAADFLETEVSRFLEELEVKPECQWQIEQDYHCGGYARVNRELVDFVSDFQCRYDMALDHVYTGKCFLGLFDLIRGKTIPEGSKIVAIHTGGLQGERGMKKQIDKVRSADQLLISSV